MCAFYQRTDWPAKILISNQNFVCNKYKFTCNNLGGWIRFVFCMFPENQDNFTLNSKSIIYSRHNIVRKGHISTTFQYTFIAGSSQMASTVSLHSQRRACMSIVSSNRVLQMTRWLFFHQMTRWFFLQQKTWSSSLDLFSFLRRSAVLLSPGPRGFCTSSSNSWEKSIYVGNTNENKTRGGGVSESHGGTIIWDALLYPYCSSF